MWPGESHVPSWWDRDGRWDVNGNGRYDKTAKRWEMEKMTQTNSPNSNKKKKKVEKRQQSSAQYGARPRKTDDGGRSTGRWLYPRTKRGKSKIVIILEREETGQKRRNIQSTCCHLFWAVAGCCSALY